MKEQALAAVEKPEAKQIVIYKSCDWAQHDVEQAEAAAAFGNCHLRAEGRAAVPVVNVIGERGVGVMEDGTGRELAAIPSYLQSLVHRPLLEPPRTSAKQA